jgi:uncharacterized lipoprotein YbaY
MRTLIKTASLLLSAYLLAGCASPKLHRTAPIAAPTNTIQYTATVAKKSIQRAIGKVAQSNPQCNNNDIATELQQAKSAIQDLHNGAIVLIRENESLAREATVLVGELEKQRAAYFALKKKHAHVLRQRNQLGISVIVFVVAVLLIVFGPTILRLLRVLILRI